MRAHTGVGSVSRRRPLFAVSGEGTWRLLALAAQLDEELLRQVFTHSSWVSERGRSYERLEFLGDSVLSLAVTTELYRRFPSHTEGHLARLRAYIVSRATCAKVSRELGLEAFLGEVGATQDAAEADQLVSNQNVLADVAESLIGALYVTFGFDTVRPAVVEAFAEHILFAEKSYVDFKTELQEFLAKGGRQVAYAVSGYSGPPHDRNFAVEAVVDGQVLGRGVGATKKSAEQEAASEALAELHRRDERHKRRVRLLGPRKPDEQGLQGAERDEAFAGVEAAAEKHPRRRGHRGGRRRSKAAAPEPAGGELSLAERTASAPTAPAPTAPAPTASAPGATGDSENGRRGPEAE